MNLDDNYLSENIDAVRRNYKHRGLYMKDVRWGVVIPVCYNCNTIISVGCGSYEPILINATHAIDIVPLSEFYLRKLGWKGEFTVASCTNIPSPNKYFDAAVCSEVIEHLPEIKDIVDTFKEVNRVAKKWIFSTPANPIGPLNLEPTHKRFLDLETLKKLTSKYKVEVFRSGIYNYVKRDHN